MTTTATYDATDAVRVQARSLRVLMLAQAVGAIGITIGIATASLLARDLSGSESLAGLAQTFQVLGTAIAAFLLARLMSQRGRRIGILTGYLLGAAGAAVAVLAGVVGSMVLLLAGAVLLGSASAANAGARYAAVDLAPESTRARSLSLVVWATTIGAVAGPNLTGPSSALADVLGIPELTGPFALGAVGMLVAALVVGVLLRPDPLLVARALAEVDPEPPTGTSWGRAVETIRERPVLLWSVLALAGAHAAMIGVMVMTPLHMEHGGAALNIIGVVISVHVLGMFAFSPVVGIVADARGRAFSLTCGGVILLVALVVCALAPEGSSWQIFLGLFLLGLGWSFATVTASTLIADHAPLRVRTDVQGTSDLIMNVTAAATGGLAGLVVDLAGYPALALGTMGLALMVILAATRVGRLAQLPA